MKVASKRARRMERHHKRGKVPALNLVSLMDIFTILIFFLLVNSSDTKQPPSRKDVKLPETISKLHPKDTLQITVTEHIILVDGVKVAVNSELSYADEDAEIPKLKDELVFRSKAIQSDVTQQSGLSVTILGSEDMPYNLLSRILATCQSANYTRIAFAALQVSEQ